MLTILAIAALTLYVSQYVSLYTDDGILSISISYCGFQRDLEKVWSLTKAAYGWTIELIKALNGLFQEYVLPMLPWQSKDESVETSDYETVESLDSFVSSEDESINLGAKDFQMTQDDFNFLNQQIELDQESEQDISDEELKELIGEEIFNQFFSKSHSYNEDTEEQTEAI